MRRDVLDSTAVWNALEESRYFSCPTIRDATTPVGSRGGSSRKCCKNKGGSAIVFTRGLNG